MHLATVVAIMLPERDAVDFPPLWSSPHDRADFVDKACEIVESRILVRSCLGSGYKPNYTRIAAALTDRIDDWFMESVSGLGRPFTPKIAGMLTEI